MKRFISKCTLKFPNFLFRIIVVSQTIMYRAEQDTTRHDTTRQNRTEQEVNMWNSYEICKFCCNFLFLYPRANTYVNFAIYHWQQVSNQLYSTINIFLYFSFSLLKQLIDEAPEVDRSKTGKTRWEYMLWRIIPKGRNYTQAWSSTMCINTMGNACRHP